ncbi:enoyl-CoA hydratase/isomerase family protein [Aureimonas flava]|uniref:Enoyl-CoA hydratase/isomerase family protein n=1 Tax=Aureimonas flava TaxID=2320271 RepID=A0A3A1WLL8_9HYPH|nr:enoyl-CoA hydratase/isomerase family protein [Aureimonas flava]RIY00267.1 enoyl-CoA hydratase/isomerase family protein [Aureimonas flava]
MPAESQTIRVRKDGGVARVTLDNPPVNVMSVSLMTELLAFLEEARADEGLKVIVFESANPDFFVAHVDMTLIDAPDAFDALAADAPEGLNVFQAFAETLRRQPQVTIVKLRGIARGGGAEFVVAADMCFAATDRGALGQIEALMGIIPGGGATQYLADRIPRNRALEIVLGADLVDAETAAAWGWINRALPDEALDGFVERIARNIAGLPEGVVAAAKAAFPPTDLRPGLAVENREWAALFARPAASDLIRSGLRAGAQTPEGERNLEALLRQIASISG